MRVAIEGCGHGTLDAIYASVLQSCAVKGWDGVDLLIIGGDFQAVRDRYDLNVTAMPAKYRQMADFHQYYWGKKTAPCLTIFVGGNHEASNHLFELYYGGWVAPNIYYLGAANVVQVGPLRIAGMSGIWKGYDYRKTHYERLPYSLDDMYSIYHVRELDVRKLLAFRSQVDIGVSHDWPKGIEWLGDHQMLFRHKPHLYEDAQSGRLGNTAAQQVMDRLRPPYWFSAHLHTKYEALKQHEVMVEEHDQDKEQKPLGSKSQHNQALDEPPSTPPHQEQLSAWKTFGARAKREEAEETTKLVEAGRARKEEAERNGVPMTAKYTFDETYKKVRLEDGFQRHIASISRSTDHKTNDEQTNLIPQSDSCDGTSPLKRRRAEDSSPPEDGGRDARRSTLAYAQTDGTVLSSLDTIVNMTNPDAIDIDMSDDETTSLIVTNASGHSATGSGALDGGQLHAPVANIIQPSVEHETAAETDSSIKTLKSGGKRDEAQSGSDPGDVEALPVTLTAVSEARLDYDLDLEDDKSPGTADNEEVTVKKDAETTTPAVSEEMRAQLAALSSKFEEPVQVTAALPLPETITNKVTRFLALSKCEDSQNFLQLLEIQPYETPALAVQNAVKLQYDPEWLAILRVFASELALGGRPQDHVPQHRGDTYYRERIIEEEAWIENNIVKQGLLAVPENFTITIPSRDNSVNVDSRDMPREVTNPQTSTFCNLIGIPNPFDISDEERDARMAAGPTPSSNAHHGKRGDHSGRGGRHGRGHGSSRGGRGRGGRGGRRWQG